MSLTQMIQILWARKLQFFSICLFTLVLVAIASVVLPKKYVAESAVVINTNNVDPIADNNNSGGLLPQFQPAYIATQMDVISSHNVALKVVDNKKLVDDPSFRKKFTEATDGQGSLRDWIADALLDSLSVHSAHNGNVIYIQYSSKRPQLAADIAEEFAQSYLQTSLELKVDPARRQSGWFDQQLKDLRSALETAQQKLSSYQKSQGLIGTDDARLDVENKRLEDLSDQLVTAQSSMYGSVAREQQMSEAAASNHPDEISDVLKSPLLQNLKTELTRAEENFADISQRFGNNNPQYKSAAAQLAAVQEKVNTEVGKARATIARDANISRQQVHDLQKAVEQQRTRILSLQHEQNDYAVLKRDADNAQTAYDNATQRSGETKLVSHLDQTNVAILNHAVVPTSPASPRLMLNLILALILGPVLGIGICLCAEMLGRHVHVREDLIADHLAPVLVEIPPGNFGGLRTRRSRPPHKPAATTLRSRPAH